MQKVTEISLLHNQSALTSSKIKNSEIQIKYFTEKRGNTKYHVACPPIPHTPCPRTKFTQVKKWQLMHNKHMLNTFTVLQ